MKNLKMLADILFRCFLISFAFLFIFLIAYLMFMPFFISFLQTVFYMSEAQIGIALFYFYGVVKIIAIFLFFVPALAIEWYEKKSSFSQNSPKG